MSFLLKALNALDAALSVGRRGPVQRDLAYGGARRRRLDVYAPRPKAAGKRPVLVFFYGGNWDSGDKGDYAFAGRAFAALGYLTVLPDYTHTHERLYPAFMEDAAAALAWVRDHIADHGGDPDRIAVAGHSAGAYIAVTLALDPRWGATDVRAGIGLAGPYDFLPFDSPVTRRTFGHVEDLPATQPVNHIRADAPPLLLATGDADTTVRPRHSEALAARLLEAGTEAELILYPAVTHTGPVKAIARPFRGHAPVLRDIAAFLKRQGL